MLTNDWRSELEVKTRVAMAKDAFYKKKNVIYGVVNMAIRKRLVKCYVWSVMLYRCET